MHAVREVVRRKVKLDAGFEGAVKVAEFSFPGEPTYTFVSGMFYTDKKVFDACSERINLNFPYTTYYKFRIPDIKLDGETYRSAVYCKLPLVAVQFEDYHVLVRFPPFVKISGTEVPLFLSLRSDGSEVKLSFALCNDFEIKTKRSVWLGFGRKERIRVPVKRNAEIKLAFEIVRRRGEWLRSISDAFENPTHRPALLPLPPRVSVPRKKIRSILLHIKTAFYRAWNERFGTFAQLPWKRAPGFALDNYHFSLLTYEAVRLNYFYDCWKISGDTDYLRWAKRLRELFLDPRLMLKPKRGRGIIWYELTNCNDKRIFGYFYLSAGYAGYPGGQATIALNLLRYSSRTGDAELKRLARLSLEYLVSTQNRDGSWPAGIKQTREIKLRFGRYESRVTTGGTAECARALLLGYKIFGRKKYLRAALKALNYLRPSRGSILAYNTLRDIGMDEVEGISSIYAVHAFLDAYEQLKDEKFLECAKAWACYFLTWFYWWRAGNLNMRGLFHPISYSITPRVSPYESLLSVNLCLRLYKVTKRAFWKRLALFTYKRVLEFLERDHGLCECYFPDYLRGFATIPMEQTFATAELLNATLAVAKLLRFDFDSLRPRERESPSEGEKLSYTLSPYCLAVFRRNEPLLTFNYRDFRFERVNNKVEWMEISFHNPYSLANRMRTALKNALKPLPLLLAPLDIKSLMLGIRGPAEEKGIKLSPYSAVKKRFASVKILSEHPLTLRVVSRSSLHEIDSTISFRYRGKKLSILFDPIVIRVLSSGVRCRQVLFPVVKVRRGSDVKILGNFDRVLREKNLVACDISLKTNWTDYGIYRDRVEIVV